MASWQDIGGIAFGDIDIDIDIAVIFDIVGRILMENSPNPYHI